MYFDSHAHYDSTAFDADRDDLLSSMAAQGVSYILNPGCDVETSRTAVELSDKYSFVYAAVGWHPQEWESWTPESMEAIRALAQRPRTVAIGEIGLDYYWDREHKELQKRMLRECIALALDLDKPVIIHDREAHADCLEAVLSYPKLRGVFHCYSGSYETAELLLRRGWYLGVDGPVTYKNARGLPEIVARMPKDRLLIETDSPYLTPEPLRGKRNDSAKLCYVAEKVASLWGVTTEEAALITSDNAKRLFGITA